jgi:hypothetical protein
VALGGCGSSSHESTVGAGGLQGAAACLRQAGFHTTVKPINGPPGFFALGYITFAKGTPASGGTAALFSRKGSQEVLKQQVHRKVNVEQIGSDYVTWNAPNPTPEARAAVRNCLT